MSNLLSVFQLKGLISSIKVDDKYLMQNQQEVLSRLKFIGTIQVDEKVHVQSQTLQPNNWRTSLSRTIVSPDSRNNTLRFLNNVITRAFELIDLHKDKDTSSSKNLCKILIRDLKQAQIGMTNLSRTYEEDTKFCCDLTVLIESVSIRLETLLENYAHLFEAVTPGNIAPSPGSRSKKGEDIPPLKLDE